ncbi:hypothetical protein ACEPAF_4679 [Sanghuangporus sanghuang]
MPRASPDLYRIRENAKEGILGVVIWLDISGNIMENKCKHITLVQPGFYSLSRTSRHAASFAGSDGSGDSRGSTAGPSTPTVVESPRIRDIQIPAEVVESTEDWYRRCFPDEGTFGPSPPDAQSLSADESALNGHPYYQNQMDHFMQMHLRRVIPPSPRVPDIAAIHPLIWLHGLGGTCQCLLTIRNSSTAQESKTVSFNFQGSARPAGRLVTTPISQGSDGTVDPRVSTASPSTPTVVESPECGTTQIRQRPWSTGPRKTFPGDGTFGPAMLHLEFISEPLYQPTLVSPSYSYSNELP